MWATAIPLWLSVTLVVAVFHKDGKWIRVMLFCPLNCDSGAMRTSPQGEDICSLQSQLRGLWVLCLRSIVSLAISVHCLFLRATKDRSNNLEF